MMPPREKGEFYKKDRKVLRFFCKYKDSRLQGDKRDYILYYYLLNDTVEIKEVRYVCWSSITTFRRICRSIGVFSFLPEERLLHVGQPSWEAVAIAETHFINVGVFGVLMTDNDGVLLSDIILSP